MKFERNKKIGDALPDIEFLERTYSGGREFTDNNLYRHERESENSFNRRKNQAFFINYSAPIIDLYTQYLFRETVARDFGSLKGGIFDAYRDDADMMGRSHEQIMRVISKMGSVHRFVGVIVDKPAVEAVTKADQIANGLHPYIALYEPEAIYDWTVARINGRPVLTKIVLKEDDGTFRVWTQAEWQDYQETDKGEYELVDSGTNPLGMIPLVVHRNRDALEPSMFSGKSDIELIAPANRAIFNIDMYAMQNADEVCFPMLTGPEEPATQTQEGGDVVVGTKSYLPQRMGEPGYSWLEPSNTSLQGLLSWRQELVTALHHMARISNDTADAVKSGVALEIEAQGLNATLSEKAEQSEKTEVRILDLVARWEDLPGFDGEIKYSRTFGVRDLERDIDIAIKSASLITSQEYKRALSEDVATRVLVNPTQEEIDRIMADIKTVKAVTPEGLNGNQGA